MKFRIWCGERGSSSRTMQHWILHIEFSYGVCGRGLVGSISKVLVLGLIARFCYRVFVYGFHAGLSYTWFHVMTRCLQETNNGQRYYRPLNITRLSVFCNFFQYVDCEIKTDMGDQVKHWMWCMKVKNIYMELINGSNYMALVIWVMLLCKHFRIFKMPYLCFHQFKWPLYATSTFEFSLT